jgi:NADH-quinone oxidoreductase subunit N
VVSLLGRKGDGHHRLDDYSGLAKREPLLALALTVFLLAQAGVPPTGGFLAKFYVLTAAVDANSYWLALVAMLSAVVSAYLYLRIVLAMYSGTKDTDEAAAPAPSKRHRVPVPAAAALAIVLALVGTLGIGILPDRLSRTADDAVPELVSSGGR